MTLCKSNGNFDTISPLTKAVKSKIWWWRENVNHLYNDQTVSNHDKCIVTDASSYRLGAVMEFQSIGGLFSTSK